jgi:hypothetical protein
MEVLTSTTPVPDTFCASQNCSYCIGEIKGGLASAIEQDSNRTNVTAITTPFISIHPFFDRLTKEFALKRYKHIESSDRNISSEYSIIRS